MVNQDDNPPKTLPCHGITQNDSFTLYRMEKHPQFYQWFSNLATDLGIEDDVGHDLNIYEVKSDTVTFYGANEEITIVVGDAQILLLFQFKPDPDTMLNHVDVVNPD